MRPEVPSTLLAWDPVQQREVWHVDYRVRGGSGLLSTDGGLLFQGAADGRFRAYATETGKELWSFDVGNAILGGPITYELDGQQYVVALAGQGGINGLAGGVGGGSVVRPNGRLLAFKLGGQRKLPQAVVAAPRPGLDLSRVTTSADPALGSTQYTTYCMNCHGVNAISTGAIPDLRYSPALLEAAAFRAIVIDGARKDKGMVSFASELGAREAEPLRAYLVQRARESTQPAAAQPAPAAPAADAPAPPAPKPAAPVAAAPPAP
jgi:mono/diheme cytochrome c family protein